MVGSVFSPYVLLDLVGTGETGGTAQGSAAAQAN